MSKSSPPSKSIWCCLRCRSACAHTRWGTTWHPSPTAAHKAGGLHPTRAVGSAATPQLQGPRVQHSQRPNWCTRRGPAGAGLSARTAFAAGAGCSREGCRVPQKGAVQKHIKVKVLFYLQCCQCTVFQLDLVTYTIACITVISIYSDWKETRRGADLLYPGHEHVIHGCYKMDGDVCSWWYSSMVW